MIYRVTTTHVETEGDADDGQHPQNAIEPPDAPTDSEPVLLPVRVPPLPSARQRAHEDIKSIDREKRDAIEQERLERIGADLGITTHT